MRVSGAPHNLAALGALGLVVWAVYVADRVWDVVGRSPSKFPAGSLHRIYAEHRGTMALMAGAACALGCLLLRDVREPLRTGWLVLAPLLALYLLAAHTAGWSARWKPHGVAALFALATCMPLLLAASIPLGARVLMLVSLAALAGWNCAAIRERTRDGLHLLWPISLTVMCVITGFAASWKWAAALLMSAAFLFALERTRGRIAPLQHRALADAALLAPLLLWPLL